MQVRLGIIPKLTLVFVLFAATLLLGIGLLVFENARALLQAATVSELVATTIEKQAALNGFVDDREADLINISHSAHLLDEIASLVAARTPSASQTAHDNVVADLQNWTGPGTGYRKFLLIDPLDGKVIAATDPSEEDKFKEDRPYFVNGKKSAYVQNPYYDVALQGPTMTIAVPIQSGDGRLLAVLAVNLDMADINTIINRRTGLHRTDDAFLVNTSNLFVTQPRLATDPSVLQRGIHSEAIDSCLARNSGTIATVDYRGVPALIVYRWLPERQLCLEVKIDQAEAFAPEESLRSTLLITGILVLVLASVLAFGLARGITRPIRRLTLGAAEIGKGNLEYRINVHTGDEIGQLAGAFNAMTENLRDTLGENTRLYAESRASAEQLEQRVKAQTETIRESEAKLRALFAAMRDVILVLDGDGRYLEIAPTDPNLLYKPPHELIGKTVRDIFPPAQADYFIAQITRALTSEQPMSVEYGMLIGDKEFWFDGIISPTNQHTVIWVARDITDRRRAEEITRNEKLLSESVINSLPGIFYLFDARGKFLRWNKNLETISGYSSAEMATLHPLELFLGEEKQLIGQKIQEVFASGTAEVEGHFVSKNGRQTPYYFSGLRVEYNGQRCLIGIGLDISERTQAEEKLKALAADLARSNAELEQFAYIASHDLQEPLRMVASYMQLIARRYQGKLDSDADEFIGYAVDGAMRMQRMINDLLTFSRVGTRGKEFQPVNIEAVLNNVLGNLEMAIKDAHAVVTYDSLPTILADESQIAQLFQNLIGNAIKFHGDAPPRVHVSAVKDGSVVGWLGGSSHPSNQPTSQLPNHLTTQPPSNHWLFSVQDNGIGIDPQFAERIFVIFQRLHTRAEYPGTGIGLAICKKIVERHNGRIWVESEPGKGTTFYFTLPANGEQ